MPARVVTVERGDQARLYDNPAVPVVVPSIPTIAANPVLSAEAFGITVVQRIAYAAGFGGETVGTATVRRQAYPSGVASLEAVSAAIARRLVNGQGFTEEALGIATVRRLVYPAGGASAGSVGGAIARRLASPPGTSSAETLGAPQLLRRLFEQPFTSSEAFGAHIVRVPIVTIYAYAIASGETFGAGTVQRIARAVAAASSEALGVPYAQRRAGGYIGSAETVGVPYALRRALAQGFAEETLGVPYLQRVARATGLVSGGSVSAAVVRRAANAIGAASAETVGVPTVRRYLYAVNVTSGEAFGAHIVGDAALFSVFPSAPGDIGLSDLDRYSIVLSQAAGDISLADGGGFTVLVIDGQTWLVSVSDTGRFGIDLDDLTGAR